MKAQRLLAAVSSVFALFAGPAGSHDLPNQLGKVTFPTSCDPKVQPLFDAAVAMQHSYWFPESQKTFNAVLERDPACAIAYWGIAVNYLGNSLVAPPPPKDVQAAWSALEKARAVGAKTQREQDWIEAISAYYRDHDKLAPGQRLAAYSMAMERMTQRYPEDFEGWAYYALTLQATARADDKTYANQRKAAEILERLVAQNPQHPGAAHYLVHAYDYPPLAAQGIKIARTYGKLAPAAPHARHMPSHIYSMVGLWEDSIASNVSALEIQPNYYHAHDFAVYAALQMAQDDRAKAFVDKAMETYRARGNEAGFNLVSYAALAAVPARYMLERADWKGAAALPVTSTGFPAADSLTRFARGLGMARSGDPAGARSELEAIKQLGAALEKSNNQYWADRTREQMLAVQAWIALAEGDRARAEELMRDAADSEDASVKHVAMENRLYPMRELLAEVLLESGRAANALREFEASNEETPNRYRGLWGAARAANAAGDPQKASGYYARLVELTSGSGNSRPEISLAKARIARR